MIEILTLGSVSNVALNYVKECIDKASRAFDLDTKTLRVVVVESREHLSEFLDAALQRNPGLKLQPLGSASHLYVAGRPTIIVVASELYEKDEAVVRGELLIALAHAKLHGSEEYYAIRVPPAFQELAELGASRHLAMAVLYLVASGVKGYEATKFAVERGYLSEMEGLYKFHLAITPEERASWIMAENDPRVRALLALNAFKALANALPVYSSSTDRELRGLFEENLDLMPPDLRSDVEKTLFDVLPREPQSTFNRLEACLESLSDIIYAVLS
jgi:hypothetical protein